MKVRITPLAQADLAAIAAWIRRDSPRYADSVIRDLRAKCADIAENPDLYPYVSAFEQRGLRRRVCGSYLIFYRAETAEIVVVRVLHGAQDYQDLLG